MGLVAQPCGSCLSLGKASETFPWEMEHCRDQKKVYKLQVIVNLKQTGTYKWYQWGRNRDQLDVQHHTTVASLSLSCQLWFFLVGSCFVYVLAAYCSHMMCLVHSKQQMGKLVLNLKSSECSFLKFV